MLRSMSGWKRWWLGAIGVLAVLVALVLARGCGGEARRGTRAAAGADGGEAGTRRAASAIVGEVREVGGAAIAGALVSVQGVGGARALATVVAGADGAFAVAVEPGRYRVRAAASGYVQEAPVAVSVERGEVRVTIAMVPASGGLVGTVGDALGGVLDGAQVEATALAIVDDLPRVAASDASGAYRMALPPGAYAVTARFDGYVAVTRRVLIGAAMRGEDFRLMPAATIRGRVLRASDRAAVAGACVRAAAVDELAGTLPEAAAPCVESDADGAFEITGLEPGMVALVASAPGLGVAVPSQIPIAVGEHKDGVELMLEAAEELRGAVVDQRGQPIAAVPVVAMRPHDQGAIAARSVSADDGTFTLSGLTAGRYLVRTTPGAAALGAAVVAVDVPAAVPVTLTVTRGVRIDGVVTPARPGRVSVRRPLDRVRFDDLATAATAEALLAATIDATGRFVLDDVPAGSWELVASTDGGGGAIAIEVADQPQTVTIELGRLASVCGVVKDRAGRALPAATVTAMAIAQPSGLAAAAFRHLRHTAARAGAPVGEGGAFCLRDLAPGAYLLVARDDHAPLVWSPRHADPAGNVVPLVLAAGDAITDYTLEVAYAPTTLRGRVIDAAGAPVADALVQAERDVPVGGDGDQHPLIGQHLPVGPVATDAAGEFALEVGPIAQRLSVEHPARGLRAVLGGVDPAQPVIVRLAAAARLHGSVTGGTGTCRVRIDGPRSLVAAAVGPDCGFTADGLTPGEYAISVRRGEAVGAGRVTLVAGADAEVTIAVAAEATIVGRVVDARGSARAGAIPLIIAVDAAAAPDALFEALTGAPARTDAAGRFAVRAPVGVAGLLILASDGQRVLAAQPLTVAAPRTEVGDVVVE